MALRVEGGIYSVVEFNHVKPCKGSSFVRLKLRDVKTGNALERTYRSAETLDDVPLEERKMQYLYNTGDAYHFMCQSTFEEHAIQANTLSDIIPFLMDNMEVIGLVYQDKVLKVSLPNFIVAEITETSPGVKGDSAKSDNKPAKIQTGATIQVPLFVDVGDSVKIDTRDGQYVERVKR
ncbi:MAG: elongation factor P [Candidatus Omnitrophota bacterium]